MRIVHAVSCLSFALSVASVHIDIPEVDSVVANVLRKFENYVDFHGNHSKTSTVVERQSTAYWYETIAHQGISAFGPSGYQVYRNVKDFGAKGTPLLYR